MAPPAMTRLRRTALTTFGVAAFAVSFAPGAAHAAPSASDLQQQIDAKGKQLGGVIQQWDGLNDQLTKTTAQAQTIQSQLAPLQAQVDAAGTAVDALAVQSYEGANFGGLTALITAGSPQNLIDRLSVLDNLGAQSKQQLAGFQSAKQQLTDQQTQLNQVLAQEQAQKATLDAQKAKIQGEIDALQKQRDQLAAATAASKPAASKPAAAAPAKTTTAPAASSKAQIAVNAAMAELGRPYVFGAAGPSTFDCSGLMQWAWAKAGVSLSHYTFTQMNNDTKPISRSQLQPGDLVFFYDGDHVGMYIGNNQVIHAPQPGEVVKISDIDWMNGYYAAGRPG